MNNNLVHYNGNEIVVAEEVMAKLNNLNKVKQQLEDYEKDFKIQLKQAMEQYGVKSIKNDYFTASYIEENTRTVFDTNKAKEYIQSTGEQVSHFEKESKVKSSIRVKYK